jgi:hypothetical protein
MRGLALLDDGDALALTFALHGRQARIKVGLTSKKEFGT